MSMPDDQPITPEQRRVIERACLWNRTEKDVRGAQSAEAKKQAESDRWEARKKLREAVDLMERRQAVPP